MTLEEAKKVAAVCGRCDSGCSVCVRDLCELLQKEFPEFVWTFNEERADRFDSIKVKRP